MKKKSGKKKAPKVKLSTKKVYILTSIICLICVISLSVNILLINSGTSKNDSNRKQNTEQTDKTEKQNTEKTDSKKTPQKTPSSPAAAKPAKTDTKPASKPSSQSSPAEQKKDTPQKSNEQKPAEIQKPAEQQKPAVTPPVPPKPAPAPADSIKNNTPPAPVENKEKYNIPQAKNGATIVIVIDDAGANVANTKKYAQLPFPLTIAVLPKLTHTKDCAYVVRSNNKELILHQPMQSMNLKLNPGPGAVTEEMNTYEIAQTVLENLKELGPGVKGLNNHEGSLITSNVIKIGAVLDVCDSQNIYFLDSRTTDRTQAPQAALERDMKIFEKAGPYLDNEISREAMLKQIYASLDVANKKGIAIIIGHVDKSAKILPDLLQDMYPYLVKKGYRFATPSQLK